MEGFFFFYGPPPKFRPLDDNVAAPTEVFGLFFRNNFSLPNPLILRCCLRWLGVKRPIVFPLPVPPERRGLHVGSKLPLEQFGPGDYKSHSLYTKIPVSLQISSLLGHFSRRKCPPDRSLSGLVDSGFLTAAPAAVRIVAGLKAPKEALSPLFLWVGRPPSLSRRRSPLALGHQCVSAYFKTRA